MALNYSDPVTRGNPAEKFRRYDNRQSQTMSGVVHQVSPLYEVEAKAIVYVFQLRTYVTADINLGHTSHNGIGDYIPLSKGDYVRISFSDGISSNPVIVSTFPKQPDISDLVQQGNIPAPDSTIQGQQITTRPINHHNEALSELNRSTVSVRRIEGLRLTSPVTNNPIAAEQPGSMFVSSPLGDESVIVPGEYRLFASNVIIQNTAPTLDASDAVVTEATQYYQFIQNQRELFSPHPFDLTGATLQTNPDFELGSATQGSWQATLDLYDQLSESALTRLQESQEVSHQLDDFISDCIAPYINQVKNNWSSIFGGLLGVGLQALNKFLPSQLQVGLSQIEGKISQLNVGGIGFDLSTNQLSIDGQSFDLSSSSLSDLNKKLPLFQQVASTAGSIIIGDNQFGRGLESIVSGGINVDPETGKLSLEGIEYSLANQGLNTINQRLPPELQVAFSQDEEGNYNNLQVGPLSINPSSGQAQYDPSILAQTTQQLINRLPPAFQTAARLLPQITNIPAVQNVLSDLGITSSSEESIATRSQSGCALSPQTLPQLVRTAASNLNLPDLSSVLESASPQEEQPPSSQSSLNTPQTLLVTNDQPLTINSLDEESLPSGSSAGGFQDEQAAIQVLNQLFTQTSNTQNTQTASPRFLSDTAFFQPIRNYYSEISSSNPGSKPILKSITPSAPHRLVTPGSLDFSSQPYTAVASLLTKYGVNNALAISSNLLELAQTGSLFSAIDTIQYAAATPLFSAITLLNIALSRNPQTQKARLTSALPTTCSGLVNLAKAISTFSPTEALDFIEIELGLPRPDINQLLEDPNYILQWANSIEPGLPITYLAEGDYNSFLLELIKYHSGRDLSLYPRDSKELKSWISKTYSPAILGANN